MSAWQWLSRAMASFTRSEGGSFSQLSDGPSQLLVERLQRNDLAAGHRGFSFARRGSSRFDGLAGSDRTTGFAHCFAPLTGSLNDVVRHRSRRHSGQTNPAPQGGEFRTSLKGIEAGIHVDPEDRSIAARHGAIEHCERQLRFAGRNADMSFMRARREIAAVRVSRQGRIPRPRLLDAALQRVQPQRLHAPARGDDSAAVDRPSRFVYGAGRSPAASRMRPIRKWVVGNVGSSVSACCAAARASSYRRA